MVQEKEPSIPRLEQQIERLGSGKFFDCPECGSRFLARTNLLHSVIVFVDGEISDAEEDALDYFCSESCANRYCELQRRKTTERYSFLYSPFRCVP